MKKLLVFSISMLLLPIVINCDEPRMFTEEERHEIEKSIPLFKVDKESFFRILKNNLPEIKGRLAYKKAKYSQIGCLEKEKTAFEKKFCDNMNAQIKTLQGLIQRTEAIE